MGNYSSSPPSGSEGEVVDLVAFGTLDVTQGAVTGWSIGISVDGPGLVLDKATIEACQAPDPCPGGVIGVPVFFNAPRVIDPAVNRLDPVYLYDIDDFEQIIRENLESAA